MISRFILLLVMFVTLAFLNGCDSEPPKLMKASFQFETDEEREHHIAHMRTHHMHALKHKRDETMYQGIRTEDHSLNACINCHVPKSHNGKVLRHTDQEHFCTTCHTYVAEKLNCFECHVDHPVETDEEKNTIIPIAKINNSATNIKDVSVAEVLAGKDLSKLSKQELIDLAFTYSKKKAILVKPAKSGGVSFEQPINEDSVIKIKKEGSNE